MPFNTLQVTCARIVYVAAFCLVALPASAGSVLPDGNFEFPGAGGPTYFKDYDRGKRLGPWEIIGAVGCKVRLTHKSFKSAPLTMLPKAGSQWLNLNYYSGGCGAAQTFAVARNTNYTLTFYTGNMRNTAYGAGLETIVQVYADGKSLLRTINRATDGSVGMAWVKYTTRVKSDGTGKMKLVFRSMDSGQDGLAGLDAITLVKVVPR